MGGVGGGAHWAASYGGTSPGGHMAQLVRRHFGGKFGVFRRGREEEGFDTHAPRGRSRGSAEYAVHYGIRWR